MSEIRIDCISRIPYVSNKDVAVLVFNKCVHGNRVSVRWISAFSLAAAYTWIQHGDVVHSCSVDVVNQFRKQTKVHWVDREVVVVLHVVNIVPLHILAPKSIGLLNKWLGKGI